MKTYIALLRGINVGGKNKLPMKDLRALLEELGAGTVQTYIQSGNVVLGYDGADPTETDPAETDPAELGRRIASAVEASHGFAPRTLVLEAAIVQAAAAANPFPEAVEEPKSLHLWFLLEQPTSPDLAMLEDLAKENERFELGERCFYLHAPDGIGRSKLAEKVERALGVQATARNWRTVSKLLAMID